MLPDREEQLRLLQIARTPKEKKQYRMPTKSKKKIAQEAAEKKLVSSDGDTLKEQWFKARRREMTGICMHCGQPSCRDNNVYFRCSAAHILPKNLFESVEFNPLNWIELCHFGNNCHTNFDNKMLDIMDLNCFDTVIERFVAIYPSIDKKERKYIPDILLQYLENSL